MRPGGRVGKGRGGVQAEAERGRGRGRGVVERGEGIREVGWEWGLEDPKRPSRRPRGGLAGRLRDGRSMIESPCAAPDRPRPEHFFFPSEAIGERLTVPLPGSRRSVQVCACRCLRLCLRLRASQRPVQMRARA